MTPDDPRHGEYAGAVAHWLAGEHPCRPCGAAATRYRKAYRLRVLRGEQPMAPSVGTRRRVRALVALGHSYAAIGRCVGMNRKDVRLLATGPDSARVTNRVAERINTAYRRLSMLPPTAATPSEQRAITLARNIAARNGWLPPLCWDDDRIDDPTYRPTKNLTKAERIKLKAAGVRTDYDHAIVERVVAGEPRPRQLTPPEADEVARRLLARGVSTYDLEHRYGLKAERYPKTPAAAASTPAAAGLPHQLEPEGDAA